MATAGTSDETQETREKFLAERALKNLFYTDWYFESARTLEFDAAARRVLERISDESEGGQENAVRTFDAWLGRLRSDEQEQLDLFKAEILHTARQGYLNTLIEAKEASAVFFQKASLLAPKDLADEFARLGAIDFEHAMRLRRLYVDLFYGDSPFPTEIRERRSPQPD